MGKLIYNNDVSVDIDDRPLAHLQVVIGSKLRRGESFYFSWRNDFSLGSGRSSAWISPEIALIFRYSGNRAPALNNTWLQALSHTSNTPTGLYIVPEPQVIVEHDAPS